MVTRTESGKWKVEFMTVVAYFKSKKDAQMCLGALVALYAELM